MFDYKEVNERFYIALIEQTDIKFIILYVRSNIYNFS